MIPLKKALGKSHQDSLQAWLIVLVMGCYFFVDLFIISMLNVPYITGDIATTFGLSATGMGWLGSMFGWGNLILVPFVGLALDRFSVKKLTLGMLLVCAAGAFGTALAIQFWLFPFFFRAISGVSHAFCFLCASMLINRWFSAKNRGIAMSLFIGLGLCGPSCSNAFLAPLSKLLGSWNNALCCIGVIPLLLFAIAFFVIEDDPREGYIYRPGKSTLSSFFNKIKEALNTRSNLMYPCIVAFINVPIAGFLFVSAGKFFEVYGKGFGALLSTSIGLGNIAGSLSGGWVAQQWKSYNKPLLTGAISCLLIMGYFPFSLFLADYFPVLAVLCFLLGFFSGMQVAAYPAIAASNKPSLIEPAMTITSFIVVLSMAAYPALSGSLAGWVLLDGNNEMLNYPWNYVKFFIPLLLSLVAAIVMLLLMEKDPYKQGVGGQEDKKKPKKSK